MDVWKYEIIARVEQFNISAHPSVLFFIHNIHIFNNVYILIRVHILISSECKVPFSVKTSLTYR